MGLESIPKCHRNGWSVINDGKPVFEEKVNAMGGPKTDFLLKHGLGKKRPPQEWFNAFLPLYDGTYSNRNHPKTPCWSHQLVNFSNMKSVILGAGVMVSTQGSLPSVMKGLNPSPQDEWKFSTQHTNPINGSDLCNHVFGKNAVKWHRQFKAFLYPGSKQTCT